MTTITSFGNWVRRQRKALDLTQAALAKQVGCAAITIRKIERDERRPSPEMAALLANHLAISETERQDFLDMGRGRYVDEIDAPASPVESPLTNGQIRHNLPPQSTPFIGRDEELVALDDLLLNPDIRLMTIVGPGGMGKTRLALACAERLVETPDNPLFPDGVFFVSLAPLSDPDHIVSDMAEAFELPLESGGQQGRSATQQILDYLHEKQMLIVMDNFEHLLAGVELVSEILRTAPRAQILATSRERLNLRPEQVFAIDGLAFPDIEALEGAAEYSAVKLFIQSARQVNHDFELHQDDLSDLTRICRLVGGMPLGVELAAAWVDTLSLEEIADEIQNSVDFLETGMRDVPDRHRSMRAVFDATWQRMTPAEQAVFPQLSVFRGGFTRKAGQTITGASLRLLSTLVNKSLIQYSQKRGRYQIHELLRQYGEEKLTELGQDDEVRERHSRYYCQGIQERESDLKGARQKEALAEIESDIENVRRAWRWAVQQRELGLLAGAMDSLGFFHEWRGRYQEGEALFRDAADALERESSAAVLRMRAKLLAWQSDFSNFVQKDEERSIQLCRQGVELLGHDMLNGIDTRPEEAFILYQMGRAGHDFGQRKEALEESLSLFREIGDAWGVANVLQILGDPGSWIGSLEECEAFLAECLTIRRELGDRYGTAQALWAQHGLKSFKAEFDKSLAVAEEAMKISAEIGGRSSPAFSNLGWHFIHLAEFDRAESTLVKSLRISRNLGDRFGNCFIQWGLYHVELARGNLEGAITYANKVSKLTLPSWLWEIGEIALIQKRFDEAAAQLQENLSKALAAKQPMQTVSSYSYLSMAEHGRGRLDYAHYYAYQGLEIPVRSQHFMIMQLNYPGLVNLLAEDGDLERAIELDTLHRSRHPWMDQSWGWEMLRRPFTECIAAMPEKVIEAARARGRQLDYWQTAEQLLKELKEKGWDRAPRE